jgi:hypothetical protein
MPRWSVDIIRKRAEHLGIVEAKDEAEAIKKAAEQLGLIVRAHRKDLARTCRHYPPRGAVVTWSKDPPHF